MTVLDFSNLPAFTLVKDHAYYTAIHNNNVPAVLRAQISLKSLLAVSPTLSNSSYSGWLPLERLGFSLSYHKFL